MPVRRSTANCTRSRKVQDSQPSFTLSGAWPSGACASSTPGTLRPFCLLRAVRQVCRADLARLCMLMAAVWVLRMVADYAGAPHWVVRVVSVTVAGSISILIAVILMHVRKFGGYANVAAAAFVLALWEQLLISAAIAFTALTGRESI